MNNSIKYSIVNTSQCALLQNCRSAMNKASLLHELILDHNSDFAFFTETWFRSEKAMGTTLRDLVPTNYSIIYANRKSNIRGGGVAIVYKDMYDITEIPLSNEPTSFEALLVTTTSCYRNRIYFLLVYRPPASPIHIFINELHDIISYLFVSNKRFVILGDFNIPFQYMNNPHTIELKNLLNDFSMIQYVNNPTHTIGNTIDLICSRFDKVPIDNLHITPNDFSDHHSISFQLNLCIEKIGKRPVNNVSRRIKKVNIKNFINDISEALSKVHIQTDANVSVNSLNNVLVSVLDNHAPLQTNKIKRMSRSWMTNEILDARRQRRKLEKNYRQTKTENDRIKYTTYCRKVEKMIHTQKKIFYNSKISGDNKINMRELYSTISLLLSNPTGDEAMKESPNDVANYFIEKIKKINSSLSMAYIDQISADSIVDCSLNDFNMTNEDELRKIINDSTKKMSPSVDPLPSYLFKNCLDIMIPILSKLINLSITKCEIPDLYKISCIKPIKKNPRGTNSLHNYRPISNLPYISKLIERVVTNRISEHIEKYNLLPQNQSAYRKNHSVETALVHISDNILSKLDSKKAIILVLLDLSAAFDTLDHRHLLNTLERSFGVSGRALLWIKNYLKNRYFYVKINNDCSDLFPVSQGVPQGSVLGPVLFSIYTTPLAKLIADINSHFFADDTQMWESFDPTSPESKIEAINHLNATLEKVYKWTSAHNLKLNPDKTVVLLLNTSNIPTDNVTIRLNDINIESQSECTDLGVLLDDRFKLRKHISKVCKTGYFWLHQLRLISKYITPANLKSAVHAFVITRIDFTNALYVNMPKKDIHRLQRLQNAAARFLENIKWTDSISRALMRLHWLPVDMRIKFKICVLVHKAIHMNTPAYINTILDVTSTGKITRASHQFFLRVPIPNTRRTGDRAFRYAAPIIWNHLPSEIRASENLHAFKNQLKTYLFNQAFK